MSASWFGNSGDNTAFEWTIELRSIDYWTTLNELLNYAQWTIEILDSLLWAIKLHKWSGSAVEVDGWVRAAAD